jgi:hypothetical protein
MQHCCAGLIGMCDFKRSNSANKEMLDILKVVLPGEQRFLCLSQFAASAMSFLITRSAGWKS